jgi:uncharacterized protein
MSIVNKVFVDTAGWIALINLNDNLHAPACKIMLRLRQEKNILVTTEFVFLELADALCATHLRQQTLTTINSMRQGGLVQVIPLSQTLFEQGLFLYSQRHDKDWGLTDCISFVVMRQEGITQAFTSDHHFEQAGFIRLMEP